jgi:hypothetical protein
MLAVVFPIAWESPFGGIHVLQIRKCSVVEFTNLFEDFLKINVLFHYITDLKKTDNKLIRSHLHHEPLHGFETDYPLKAVIILKR